VTWSSSIVLPCQVISLRSAARRRSREAEVEVEVEVERAVVGGLRQDRPGGLNLLAAPTSVVVQRRGHHRAAARPARQGTEDDAARQRRHRHQQHVTALGRSREIGEPPVHRGRAEPCHMKQPTFDVLASIGNSFGKRNGCSPPRLTSLLLTTISSSSSRSSFLSRQNCL
jgi:hypothetical protein